MASPSSSSSSSSPTKIKIEVVPGNRRDEEFQEGSNEESNNNFIGDAESDHNDNDDDDDDDDDDLLLLGTEDREIKRLDRTGCFQDVIGSQSLLSQELLPKEEEEEENRSETAPEKDSLLARTGDVSSSPLVTPIKREQILTQVEDDDGEDDDDEVEESHLLGTEEEEIRRLDQSGMFKEVIGSQSLLSQELLDMGTTTTTTSQSHHHHHGGITSLAPLERLKELEQQGVVCRATMISSSSSPKRKHKEENAMNGTTTTAAAAAVLSLSQSPKKSPRVTTRSMKRDTPPPHENEISSTPETPCTLILSAAQTLKQLTPPKTPTTTTTPRPYTTLTTSPSPSSSSRKQLPPEIQHTAQMAATFTRSILSNTNIYKEILLSMALSRENPRFPKTDPPPDTIIQEGFFWGRYPSLELILRRHMAEYYELSTQHKQTRLQQSFNNKLVVQIKREASNKGWTFEESLEDKQIRDRIRCFFKTHIQNSKKRLKTMLKNPTKRANAKALCRHWSLIENCTKRKKRMLSERKEQEEEEEEEEEEDTEMTFPSIIEEMQQEDIKCDEVLEEESNDKEARRVSIKMEEEDNVSKQNEQDEAPQPKPNHGGMKKGEEVKIKQEDDTQEKQNTVPSSLEELDDYDAAQQVIALGFARLSQDTQVRGITT